MFSQETEFFSPRKEDGSLALHVTTRIPVLKQSLLLFTEFMPSEDSYQYDPEDGGPSTDIAIDEIGLVKGQNCSLHYDYGDDRMCTIHVQKIEEESRKNHRYCLSLLEA